MTINERIKECVDLGYSIRRITLEVNLSYTAVRMRLKKLNLSTLGGKVRIFHHVTAAEFCVVCGNKLVGLQTKFCSTKCKGVHHSPNSYEAQVKRAKHRKVMLINELGGECSVCGYDKNIAALEFHHREPRHKLINLDSRVIANRKLSTIRKELKKCDLVCSNCHREIHNPALTS